MYLHKLIYFGYIYGYMVEMRVNRDKNGRTSFYVPSFIRDKHNLQNGDIVDVDTKGNKIIVTIKKA